MSNEEVKVFRATWDNAKCANIRNYDLRFGKQEHLGVVFPNGKVAIDMGFGWDTYSEMVSHFKCSGNLEVVFLNEEKSDHAQAS